MHSIEHQKLWARGVKVCSCHSIKQGVVCLTLALAIAPVFDAFQFFVSQTSCFTSLQFGVPKKLLPEILRDCEVLIAVKVYPRRHLLIVKDFRYKKGQPFRVGPFQTFGGLAASEFDFKFMLLFVFV